MLWIVAVQLITLNLVDGRTVTINPQQVTRLSEARDAGDEAKEFADGVRCVVFLTDGKFVSVVQECNAIRELMEAEER